jgi:hypothetical protein
VIAGAQHRHLTGLVADDQDHAFDLHLLAFDQLDERVEVPPCRVDALIAGDQDVHRCIAHSASSVLQGPPVHPKVRADATEGTLLWLLAMRDGPRVKAERPGSSGCRAREARPRSHRTSFPLRRAFSTRPLEPEKVHLHCRIAPTG